MPWVWGYTLQGYRTRTIFACHVTSITWHLALYYNTSSSINWADISTRKQQLQNCKDTLTLLCSQQCCMHVAMEILQERPPFHKHVQCFSPNMVWWRWWANHHSCIRRWETAKYSLVAVSSFTSWLRTTFNWPEMKTIWTLPTRHVQLPSSEVALTLLWVAEELWTLGRPCGRPQ